MSDKPRRQLGILKKVSLATLAEGWGECYINVTPATLAEMRELKNSNPKDMTDDQGLDMMLGLIKNHFVSGKIMVVGADGESLELTAAEAGDIDSFSIEINNAIFEAILGQKLDPKAMPQATTPKTPPSLQPNEQQ